MSIFRARYCVVGHSLEISERPLADRLLRIRGQDGLMVSRPL